MKLKGLSKIRALGSVAKKLSEKSPHPVLIIKWFWHVVYWMWEQNMSMHKKWLYFDNITFAIAWNIPHPKALRELKGWSTSTFSIVLTLSFVGDDEIDGATDTLQLCLCFFPHANFCYKAPLPLCYLSYSKSCFTVSISYSFSRFTEGLGNGSFLGAKELQSSCPGDNLI